MASGQQDRQFRLAFVYGSITAVVVIAMLCRTLYLVANEDEFKDRPDEKRLSFRFFFMQIPIINKWMLFWPLLTMAMARIHLFGSDRAQEFDKEVVCKWLLSYVLFMTFYYTFNLLTGSGEADFDPSGHIACALCAQSQHASIYIFARRDELHKPQPLTAANQGRHTLFRQEAGHLEVGTLCSFLFFQVHACYSIFFTALIFHTVIECLVGAAFGYLIVIMTFETDLVSASVYDLATLTLRKLTGR